MNMTLSEDNFAETVSSAPVFLVNFTSDFCGPCQSMSHTLELLESEHEVVSIAHVKAIDHREWVEAFNIQSTPTSLLFHHGRYTSRITGAHPKTTIEKWISKATI